MKKRIALVLALVMIFSIMPMSAFGLHTVGSGDPRTIGETDPIRVTGHQGEIRVRFDRDDFALVQNRIAAQALPGGVPEIFEMRVELDNGEVWNHVNSFTVNLGGFNQRATVVQILDDDRNPINAAAPAPGAAAFDPENPGAADQIDAFRVQFIIDAAAVAPDTGSNAAFFTVRLNNVIATDDTGQVTADLSAAYFRTPAGIRDMTSRLFRDDFNVWGTATLFNLADGVDIWMDTVKHFARGGMWSDIGEIWFYEDVPGAWAPGDSIELELPRGFYWDQAARVELIRNDRDNIGVNVAGMPNDTNIPLNRGNNPVAGVNITGADVTYAGDANLGFESRRVVEITLPNENVFDPNVRSRFAIEGLRIAADRRLGQTGEVVAEVDGDPNFRHDEITVAIYGESVVDIAAVGEPETVWAGDFNELNQLDINESIWEAIPRNATIELTLPEGVKWRNPDPTSNDFRGPNYLDADMAPELENRDDIEDLAFVGFDNNGDLVTGVTRDIAWFIVDNNRQTIAATVSHESTDRGNTEVLDAGGGRAGAQLRFENLQVAVESQYADYSDSREIPVKVQVHGWEETVILGEVQERASVSVEEIVDVKLGLRDQPVANIIIEEFEPGAIDRGIISIWLEGSALARHKFTKTPTLTVTGSDDIRNELQYERIWMSPDRDTINIQIKDTSQVDAATLILSDIELTLDRTAPEGPIEVFMGGGAIMDPGTSAQPYFLESDWLQMFEIANVENPHDRPWHETDGEEEVEVGFTVGSTSYTVNGMPMTMDVAPFVQDGRMMVPVRYLEPVFGVQPSWSDSARTVTIPYEGAMYSMQIGSNQLMVNGTPMIDMEAPAQIVSERTFVPISRFARAMGIEYDWDAAAQSVTFFR